jgi:hypothetical protein
MIEEMMIAWLDQIEIQDNLAASGCWRESRCQNVVFEGEADTYNSRDEQETLSDSDGTTWESATKNSDFPIEVYMHPKRMKKLMRKRRQKQNKLLGKLGLLKPKGQ